MSTIFQIIFISSLLVLLIDTISVIKLAQDLCRKNPELDYCKPIVENSEIAVKTEIRRAPIDFGPLLGGNEEKSPLAFGQATGNTANFDVPGLGNLGLGTSVADIAKFIPAGAIDSKPNGGSFDIGDSQFGFFQNDHGTGRTKERHGKLSIAGLGSFDVGKKTGNGGMIANFLDALIPKLPEPPGGIENPRQPPREDDTVIPYYYSNSYEGNADKYKEMLEEFKKKTKAALAAKTKVADSEENEEDEDGKDGFIEQTGFEHEKLSAQPMTINELRASAGYLPLSELGLKKEQVYALCHRFSVIAAQHCYGNKIEQQFIERCRGYNADCVEYIVKQKPLGAVANSFSSNVGLTYFNVGVNGIPYYAVNEEGSVGVGHNGKVDFGSWGGGYSDSLAVKDYWTQTSESGANWYEGLYGYKTGWHVPIASQFGVEGGGGTHISVPIKEGSFGQPIQVSNGYHVGPYVGLAESVGVDWYNGGVSSQKGFSLPIVGVSGNSGTSVGFPSLGTAMKSMGLGNIGVANGAGK